ncbi:hypothetical protein A3D85_00280 [Candidatus Amesbacteria bacterium RIFCSPHIGHO2_02_FULL_47_9]|uniref:Sec-independent protein translocase protein TatA n=1 Tax=Candidatus Amesbacteria bacterium RIFCSPHIGHO2_01_FULL_48_32b TaxID=1797253 RepID=A0A1F4YEM7_9BACT|nr:MAG: hypothetical protein A2876_02230 [Candidatus Amesbacteria bacterium RIFCSPHIGHO2_01_FULL_48_32b]OGD02439.1 MAG: hypothetical protein A3D85_00280 [Candidatus Amesbacteria bacterium RIFCSPHIGHO2_02_FULL_47_9]OGD06923.1 MAG: hypothetical protein A2899_03430 [Candidatus Amesbacteria bacterium RIFCSPLOWO2_01_FULL_49_25]
MFDFIKNIGLTELLIIAAILLILFGGKKVKELSHGLGESSKELKKVKAEFESAVTDKSDKPQES